MCQFFSQPFKFGDDCVKKVVFPAMELLTLAVLPFINCDISRREMSGVDRTPFALQCLLKILEVEKTCHLQIDWTKLQPISLLACLSELLHQCLVIWNVADEDRASVRLHLKERTLRCLDLLTEKINTDCCSSNFGKCDKEALFKIKKVFSNLQL